MTDDQRVILTALHQRHVWLTEAGQECLVYALRSDDPARWLSDAEDWFSKADVVAGVLERDLLAAG